MRHKQHKLRSNRSSSVKSTPSLLGEGATSRAQTPKNSAPVQRWEFSFLGTERGDPARSDLKVTQNPELIPWLSEQLSGALSVLVPRARVRAAVLAGAVFVNRVRCRVPGRVLRPQDRIEIYSSPDRLASLGERERRSLGESQALDPLKLEVVYEDEWLIAVNKPSGLPTQATLDKDRVHLFGLVQERERQLLSTAGGAHRLSKQDSAYIGLHHRLDRDTSGIVLLTRSRAANAGVSELFQKHLIEKKYEAWVSLVRASKSVLEAEAGATFEVRNRLAPVSKAGKAKRFGSVPRGGDSAHTKFEWKWLSPSLRVGALHAWPQTGRTHQIRVHLSELGLPILGDSFYGGPLQAAGREVPRIMLHAETLSFSHPITGSPVVIQASWPQCELNWIKHLSGERIEG
jgi:RluA family pseudouridine synthase